MNQAEELILIRPTEHPKFEVSFLFSYASIYHSVHCCVVAFVLYSTAHQFMFVTFVH